MGFYDIQTSVDMFRKLEREHARLPGDTSDQLFNFFVTAGHIDDYREGVVNKNEIKEFMS